jgi:putative Ig domain-containing protein
VPPPPVITSANSATATQGSLFTYQITATNNPTGYNATGLPAGIGVNLSTGLISGTATSTGTGNIAITASNAGGSGTASVFFTVLPPAPVITSSTNVMATEGASFSYQIIATNAPASYNASGLPSGLTLNTSSGLISGTVTATGTSTVTISAINLGGTGSALLTLPVVTPYTTWQNSVFTAAQLADPTISGDSAEPAGDGIPNLLKYALNLNPFIVGESGLPVASIATTGSGNYLTLTYTRVLSATDITYTVQVSTDLQNWNSGPGFTDPPVATGTSNGVTQLYNVQAAQPEGTEPEQFIRLQVTGP